MGADGIEADDSDDALAFHDQIGGIALKTLHQAAVAFRVAGQSAAGRNRITEFVQGKGAT